MNIAIAQSGGPTCAINATLAGVINGCLDAECIDRVYGMKNGIEWLGFYPLFHAASLLQIQGYNALGNEYNYSGFAFFWLAAALCFSWVLYWDLVYAYECKGQ